MSETQAHQSSKSTIRNVLRVAIILSIVTGIEFVVAFSMDTSIVKTGIFILLTVVKAFYIVGDFMHLSYEKKSFIWSVLFPMVLIVLLIFILLYESEYMVTT